MDQLLLILSGYRTWLIGVIAILLWVLAYYSYFRQFFRRARGRTKPHSWSIDMVNKRAMRGNRVERE